MISAKNGWDTFTVYAIWMVSILIAGCGFLESEKETNIVLGAIYAVQSANLFFTCYILCEYAQSVVYFPLEQ